MKKFFEALGIEPVEIDEDTVVRLIETVLPDKEESLFIRQCYGICCQKKTLVALSRETGLSMWQVSGKRGRAMYILRRSPKTTEMLALAEEKRWSLKDKDLRNLRLQVKGLIAELFSVSRSLDWCREELSEVRTIPQISAALRNEPNILDMAIDNLGLTGRPFLCLKRAGITTVGQLISKHETDLFRTAGLGRISLNEIKEALAVLGLTLGMRRPV